MRDRLAGEHPRMRLAAERDGEFRRGTGRGRVLRCRLSVGDRPGEVASPLPLAGPQVQYGRLRSWRT